MPRGLFVVSLTLRLLSGFQLLNPVFRGFVDTRSIIVVSDSLIRGSGIARSWFWIHRGPEKTGFTKAFQLLEKSAPTLNKDSNII
jgi:hypothetical protein